MATRFYFCEVCGNVTIKLENSGVPLVCCGKEMKELVPGITDGIREKHIPVVEKVDEHTFRVKVGSLPHPMTKEHSIRFIFLETEKGGQFKYLDTDGPAEVTFCRCKDKPVAVYEYCNLHGLWKTDLRGGLCCTKDNCKTE